MKKRLILFSAISAAIMTFCVCSGHARSDGLSDNVNDYEVLRKPIFNPNNNAVDPNYPNKLYIMYISTDVVGKESITVHNNSGRQVDMSHWTLGNSWNPKAYLIPSGTVMYQGNRRLFSNPGLGFQFYGKGEVIYLKDYTGTTIDMWKN